jgi:hypothetical protein
VNLEVGRGLSYRGVSGVEKPGTCWKARPESRWKQASAPALYTVALKLAHVETGTRTKRIILE